MGGLPALEAGSIVAEKAVQTIYYLQSSWKSSRRDPEEVATECPAL